MLWFKVFEESEKTVRVSLFSAMRANLMPNDSERKDCFHDGLRMISPPSLWCHTVSSCSTPCSLLQDVEQVADLNLQISDRPSLEMD